MKTVVVRNIKRADADLVKRLGALGGAPAHEAYGRFGLMKPYLRPVWTGGEGAGTAVTALGHPGDNWMIHVAGGQGKPRDILGVGGSARKDAADVVTKGEKRAADEEGKRKLLAEGKLGLDMYNMREPLAKAGLIYLDEPEED